jgi:hypothetical protein
VIPRKGRTEVFWIRADSHAVQGFILLCIGGVIANYDELRGAIFWNNDAADASQ